MLLLHRQCLLLTVAGRCLRHNASTHGSAAVFPVQHLANAVELAVRVCSVC
jgi:hypothetical protein